MKQFDPLSAYLENQLKRRFTTTARYSWLRRFLRVVALLLLGLWAFVQVLHSFP